MGEIAARNPDLARIAIAAGELIDTGARLLKAFDLGEETGPEHAAAAIEFASRAISLSEQILSACQHEMAARS